MRGARRLLGTTAALAVLAGCGMAPVDPAQLLRDAKHSIDSASSVHFTLTSQNVSGAGPLITGGEGDARRPNSFAGSLSVIAAGFTLSVDVVSSGGVFYARTPLSSGFARTNPATYGFGDPAQLLDPNHGLSSLLPACTSPSNRPADRLNGEQLDEVGCSLPGARVAALLTSADPTQPVAATIGVDPSSHQLRRVALVGPFFERAHFSTFTVILDMYGENVTITPPAG
ncbi:MAG TPA: LppX_LprAFG lipoprotein [Candidatus Dormibacteraeota bacterium]|nr:LppX_LprAFG lipoprotein [Candidatus Dormibacteraeota bacterium]